MQRRKKYVVAYLALNEPFKLTQIILQQHAQFPLHYQTTPPTIHLKAPATTTEQTILQLNDWTEQSPSIQEVISNVWAPIAAGLLDNLHHEQDQMSS